jgi:molecular chaperone HscC
MFIGIDLGTTHSLVAVWRDGASELIVNSLGGFLTPSVVSIDKDGSILVGQPAKERLQSHPERTAAAFKRGMGTDKQYVLAGRSFRAEELSALVLRSLKADAEAVLGMVVDRAVITVPAYFSEAQRHATRAAGLLAGFTEILLLNEPTAAALAYGLHQKQAETQFLVFDLGGGTFDVSVLEIFDSVMEVRATAGDNQLGGDDVDAGLARAFVVGSGLPARYDDSPATRARVLASVEAAKRSLGQTTSVPVEVEFEGAYYRLNMTVHTLDQVLKPFLERLRIPVERALRDAKVEASQLDAVVLAGGSTRLGAIRALVARMFGRFPETAMNPDEVVALGAAVQAGLRMKDAALAERVMTDVCPYTLGVSISRQLSSGQFTGGFMSAVLERNTVIPASRVQNFSPVADHQNEIKLAIYQGESRRVADNIHLGDLDVPLERGKSTEVSVDVRFTYDASGLLEVEATPYKLGRPSSAARSLVLQNGEGRLSPHEVSRLLDALSSLKIHPRERMQSRALLARAERMYSQLLGGWRDSLGQQIAEFEHALECQDEKAIATRSAELSRAVAMLDDASPGLDA